MAYDFNGTDQYLTTATTPVTAKPITIFGHAYWDTDVSRFIAFVGQNNGSHRVQLSRSDSTATDYLGFSIPRRVSAQDVGPDLSPNATSTTSIGENVWFNAAGVYTASNSRTAYLNGGSAGADTGNSGSANAYNSIAIGARYSGTAWGGFLDGRTAEIAVWNVALTAAEIASLGKGFKPYRIRPQSLVFYAPLIRNIQDTKGGRTITNNNTATVAAHPRVI